MAALWQKRVGGRVWAYKGQSDYSHIMYSDTGIISKIGRKMGVGFYANEDYYIERMRSMDGYGFSRTGSFRYPTAGSNAKMIRFG